jgi:hypothetical protein
MHVALVVGIIGLTPVHGSMHGLKDSGISQKGAEPPASPLLAPPTKDPFSGIFVAPKALRTLPHQPLRSTEKPPRVVCGMVLIPVNPNVDPKIAVEPRRKPNVEHKIRVLTPQVCRE